MFGGNLPDNDEVLEVKQKASSSKQLFALRDSRGVGGGSAWLSRGRKL